MCERERECLMTSKFQLSLLETVVVMAESLIISEWSLIVN